MATTIVNRKLIVHTEYLSTNFISRMIDSFRQINRILTFESVDSSTDMARCSNIPLNVLSVPVKVLKYVKGFSRLPREILDYIYSDLLGYSIITASYVDNLMNRYLFDAYSIKINKPFGLLVNINDVKSIYREDDSIFIAPHISFILGDIQESKILNINHEAYGRKCITYKYKIKLVSNNINTILNNPILKGMWHLKGEDMHRVTSQLQGLVLPNVNNIIKYVLLVTEDIDSYYERITLKINACIAITNDGEVLCYNVNNISTITSYYETSLSYDNMMNPDFRLQSNIVNDMYFDFYNIVYENNEHDDDESNDDEFED